MRIGVWLIIIMYFAFPIAGIGFLGMCINKCRSNREKIEIIENRKLKPKDIIKPIVYATVGLLCFVHIILITAIQNDEVLTRQTSIGSYRLLPLYILDSNGNAAISTEKYVERDENETRFLYEPKSGEIGIIELPNEYVIRQNTDETPYYAEEVKITKTVIHHFWFWEVESEENTFVQYVVFAPADAVLYKSDF